MWMQNSHTKFLTKKRNDCARLAFGQECNDSVDVGFTELIFQMQKAGFFVPLEKHIPSIRNWKKLLCSFGCLQNIWVFPSMKALISLYSIHRVAFSDLKSNDCARRNFAEPFFLISTQ